MRDFLQIVKRNFISPIVIAILLLASVLLFLKETRDAFFISGVILLNTMVAVIQETRARNELKKLELMSAPRARLLKPNKQIVEVMFNELSVGDRVLLKSGDEVPADGVVMVTSGLEANESVLSGESASIDKNIDDIVYAGSVIVAGSAEIIVTAVKNNTKIGAMSSELKRYIPQLTPTQKAVSTAISVLTYGALGMALLIYVSYTIYGFSAIQILKTITSSAVTFVPEGLLLGSTLLLAYGSIRLAQVKVLPQKLASIEAMAQLNVLCVDKTGTLTSDEITYEKLELLSNEEQLVKDLIGIVSKETSSGSSTGDAIALSLPAPHPDEYKIIEIMAFSSIRKMSGVKVNFNNENHIVLMGAPEYVWKYADVDDKQKTHITKLASFGKRVLLVAALKGNDISIKNLKDLKLNPVGFVILSNNLRDGVKDTIKYLQDNKVEVKVISGDNLNTVSYIAKKAGIKNYDISLNGQDLNNIKEKDWEKTIKNTTIFARVLPEQKERIVETLRKIGKYTGMVGDGVNDALALKKSDLGVAMYAGASATRRVADVILLDNSFNSLPVGMKLGNRIVQAIELISALFFHKIIYAVILLILTISLGLIYPFGPRHITFMNIFLVTTPTIMWTLFTPIPRRRISPRHYWKDTLFAVMPIAILSGLAVTVSYAVLRVMHPENLQGVMTTTVLIATFFGIYLVFLVPRMFDIKNTKGSKIARLLYVLVVLMVSSFSFGIGFLRDFFDFSMPTFSSALPLLSMIACVAILQWIISTNAGVNFKKRQRLDS